MNGAMVRCQLAVGSEAQLSEDVTIDVYIFIQYNLPLERI